MTVVSDLLSVLLDLSALLSVVGMGLLALASALTLTFVYRWYSRQKPPINVAILIGLAAVSLWLNTDLALKQVITAGNLDGLETNAIVTIASFLVGGLGASLGHQIGDDLAVRFFAISGVKDLNREMSQLVQSVGRTITVTLPDDIHDIEGYDPVDNATTEKLAGISLVFPRRLTVGELKNRLISRLKEDYSVGHVDIELDESGTITFLAIGSRAAGLGPTIPPGKTAVAIRADPAHGASAGDLVQIWEPGSEPELVTAAELRATVEDVVTVVVDAGDADRLSADDSYRLITMPSEPLPDREFASLLRVADETMGAITVHESSALVGTELGNLDTTVVAVKPQSGGVTAIPARGHVLEAGDTIYAIVRPDELRRLEAVTGPSKQHSTVT